ncbi:MAG: 50S ribosomal protein L9 [Bryobacterales bacterium]|nr:50S ribosomal protein L9 [Bryobacterales bacterium]
MHEVILKKDIYKLGERGDVVKVKDGYARNYLFPQQLAIPADKGSLKQLEQMRAAAAKEAVRLHGDATKQLEALEGVVVRMVVRASLNNQLYGSVSARDIAAKLNEQGFGIDRQRVQLTTPLRTLGDYEIPIHIYKELSTTIKVEVRAEGREDEPLTRTMQPSAEFEFAPPTEPEASEEGTEGEGGEHEAAPGEASAAETDAPDQALSEESASDAAEPPAEEAAAQAAEDSAASPAEDADRDAGEAMGSDGA